MNIVIFNWRDLHHPKAGGAEVATHQLASGFAAKGHLVTWYTSTYSGASSQEQRNGYTVIRRGSEVTCRFHGLQWLRRHRANVDVAIDEVNTLPFLSRLVLRKRVVVWMHQLAREVWLAEAPPLIGQIGFLLEPALLWIYRKTSIVTISQSSAASFRDFGLHGPIHVAEITLRPPAERPGVPSVGRIGYVGRIAPSKRVDHIIRALSILRRTHAAAELVIVGSGREEEVNRLKGLAQDLGVEDGVRFAGRVSSAERDEIMRSLDVLAMSSLREGWGLVVSEAARFGVPSVVYPVPGLVDSVQNSETGLVVAAETPESLATGLSQLISDRALRDRLGNAAMKYLHEFHDGRFIDRYERVLLEVAAQR